MGVQNNRLQLLLNGVYTTVATFATPVVLQRGTDAFGSWPRANKITCEIDNDALDYDPTRPTSLLYGIAGRNTPVRILDPDFLSITRGYAEATDWDPDRTIDHVPGVSGRSSVALTAEGVLRRIGTWTDPLRSPMYRTYSTIEHAVGHFSLEGESGATALDNSVVGGPEGTITGNYTLGDSDAPLGAAQSLRLSSTPYDTEARGKFIGASVAGGWQVLFSFEMDMVPADGTYETLLAWTTTNGTTWQIMINNIAFRVQAVDATNTLVLGSNVLHTGSDILKWLTFSLLVTQDGPDVDSQAAWYQEGDIGFTYWTPSSFLGAVGDLDEWALHSNPWTVNARFSHILGVGDPNDVFITTDTRDTLNGYNGERADRRLFRVLDLELGIDVSVRGFVDYTGMPMGPQPVGTALDIVREIRETEGAPINDYQFGIGLLMFTRSWMYNQEPTLELTYPGDITPPFRARLTDDGVANVVTAKNRRGGEYTVRLDSGPMSTQPPPAGVGEYRKTVDVNVFDESQLKQIASWWLNRGTLGLAQYLEVTVDLVANPGLRDAVLAVRDGDHITVAGYAPDLLHFLVVGTTERKTSGTFTVTMAIEPYEIFMVGVYGSTRYGSKTSTLNAGYSASATTMVVRFTDLRDAWSTTAEPYDWDVAGERITVISMGAITGSGPWTQSATVTRAVNGVSKAQASGAPVQLHLEAPRGRYAL